MACLPHLVLLDKQSHRMLPAILCRTRRIRLLCMYHVPGMRPTPDNLFGPGTPDCSRRVSTNPDRSRTHLPCRCRALSMELLHRLGIQFHMQRRGNPLRMCSALHQRCWACTFLCHCTPGPPGLLRRSPSTVCQEVRPSRRHRSMHRLVLTRYHRTDIRHDQSKHSQRHHRTSLSNLHPS